MNNIETETPKNTISQNAECAGRSNTFGGDHKEVREKDKKAVIISGFPGIGKSTLFSDKAELEILDSDSSNFSWSDETKTQRNPSWPQNYIEHIKEKRDKSDLILVSSHDVIRTVLVDGGIPFTLVYPSLEMKDEYSSLKTECRIAKSTFQRF